MTETPTEEEEEHIAPDELFLTAELLHESIQDAFNGYGVMLPGRQYITWGGRGDSVHDCEQLTISIEQVYTGMPGEQANTPQPCFGTNTVAFSVELVRCIPTPTGKGGGRPPEAEKITEMARTQSRDAMILLEGGMNAIQAQDFLPGTGGGGVADVAPSPPQGGYQAVILTIIMPVYAGPTKTVGV